MWSTHKLINEGLQKLAEWIEVNSLEMNAGKTRLIVLAGNAVVMKKEMKDLDMKIDE